MRPVSEGEEEFTMVIRNDFTQKEVLLKLARKRLTHTVSAKMAIHAKASSIEHVETLHHRGSSSTEVYFGIME